MNNQSHMPFRQLTLIAKDGGIRVGWVEEKTVKQSATDKVPTNFLKTK